MLRIKMHEAKTRLSELVKMVEAGEDVVICRGDLEVARLVPVNPAYTHAGAAYPASFPNPSEPGVMDASAGWSARPFAWDGKSPRKPGALKGIIGPSPAGAFAPMSEEEIAEWEGFPPPRNMP